MKFMKTLFLQNYAIKQKFYRMKNSVNRSCREILWTFPKDSLIKEVHKIGVCYIEFSMHAFVKVIWK